MSTLVNEVTWLANEVLDYDTFVVFVLGLILILLYILKEVTMMSEEEFGRSLNMVVTPVLFPLTFIFLVIALNEVVAFWG